MTFIEEPGPIDLLVPPKLPDRLWGDPILLESPSHTNFLSRCRHHGAGEVAFDDLAAAVIRSEKTGQTVNLQIAPGIRPTQGHQP
jgi:hypothetical protein